jgi:hypothetical protein
MTRHEMKVQMLATRLAECPSLEQWSAERDELWLGVRDLVCTRGLCLIVPMGSSSPVPVTPEHSTDELIAAMEWLSTHEEEARRMLPSELFKMLRGVATRGALGSARAAQADSLHGLTHVSPGEPVIFAELDHAEVA